MIALQRAATCLEASRESDCFNEWRFPDGTLWTRFFRTSDGFRLHFPGLADFDVSSSGAFVAYQAIGNTTEETVRHLYLNQVLPLALSLQGKRVFHASAVESPAGALVFLGESGRGKSTLAASFALSGHRFLTDDALLVEQELNGYSVHPSHPSIRLWADSREQLVSDQVERAPAVQYTSKERLLSGEGLAYCPDARPLRRMYFLGEGVSKDVEISPMGPGESLIGLVKNSFLLDIEGHGILASHFDEVADMAKLPIYFKLDYPRDYAALPRIRQAILLHSETEPIPKSS